MITAGSAWLLLGSSCPDKPPADDDAYYDPADTDTYTTNATTTTLAGPSFGFVTVSSGTVPAALPESTPTSATAGFLQEGPTTECIRQTLDANCVEVTCTVLDPGELGGVSAGTLDIAGLTAPIELVESDVYAGLYLGFYQAAGPSYFTPGEDVTVIASGGIVPSFTLTAAAPQQYLVLTDPPPEDGLVTITAETGLRYAWEPTDGGAIRVDLYFLEGPDTLRSVECSRLGTPLVNEVIIPLTEKDKFNGRTALESVRYSSSATAQAGDYAVTFEMSSPVVTEAGTQFVNRTIQFELD